MFTLLTSLFIVLIVFVLSLFVLISNPKSKTHIYLFIFLIVNISWVFLVQLLPTDIGENIYFARLIFSLGLLQALVLIMFVTNLTNNFLFSKKWISILYSISVILSFHPLLIKSLEIKKGAIPVPNYGLAIYFYALAILLAFFMVTYLLVVDFKRSKNNKEKNRDMVIIVGFVGFMLISTSTNLIIPSLAHNTSSASLAPLSSLVLAIFLTYSIVRHRFLDIRLIVARSLAYFLLVVTISSIYAVMIFGVSKQFFPDNTASSLQQLTYIALAVFLAFTFQSLKKFFDRLTNKMFFRDLYDSEEFLNALGNELSEQKDFTALLQNSLVLFSDTLKSSRASLVILSERHDEVLKISNVNGKGRSTPSFNSLSGFNQKLLTSKDELNVGTIRYQMMKKHDLDIILRLGEKENITGYLLLARKRGGNSYTAQDVKVLEIASKQLAVAIRNARYVSQIAEFNKTLQAEVKRATSRLEKSNEKLRHLDEAKDEFVSMASHQLRTPLTTIKGYLSMLSEGDAGEITKMQQKFVGEAFTATQRMVYLISDLLNVSRISTGKFVLNETTVDFAKIIGEEVGQLKRAAETKDIKLEYKKPSNLPLLMLDKTKVSQVVMNFIDNALYYTPKKGKVVVDLLENNSYIELTVTDNGIGVPKFEQHQLFTKFFRAENAREARPDGTGLGLYMAKKVIIAQGGSIIFESREGKGSTFGFRFPKSRVVASKNK